MLGSDPSNAPLLLAVIAALGAAGALFVTNRRRSVGVHAPSPPVDASEPLVRTVGAPSAGRAPIGPTVWDLFFASDAEATTTIDDALLEHGVLKSLPDGAPRLQGAEFRSLWAAVGEQIAAALHTMPLRSGTVAPMIEIRVGDVFAPLVQLQVEVTDTGAATVRANGTTLLHCDASQ